MNFIKKLLNRWKADATKRLKAPILRELDRAIGKAESGQVGRVIIPTLVSNLTKILRVDLPEGVGEYLLRVLLADVNWNNLVDEPAHEVRETLIKLRRLVEGARL